MFFWGGQKCSSQSGGEGRFLTSQSGGRFLREEVFLFFFSLLSHCSLIALSPPSGQILLSLLLSFLFCFSFSLSLSPTPPSPPGQIPFSCILLSVLVLFAFARALSLSLAHLHLRQRIVSYRQSQPFERPLEARTPPSATPPPPSRSLDGKAWATPQRRIGAKHIAKRPAAATSAAADAPAARAPADAAAATAATTRSGGGSLGREQGLTKATASTVACHRRRDSSPNAHRLARAGAHQRVEVDRAAAAAAAAAATSAASGAGRWAGPWAGASCFAAAQATPSRRAQRTPTRQSSHGAHWHKREKASCAWMCT